MVEKNVSACGICGSAKLETLVEIPRYYYLVRPTEFQNEWRETQLSVGVCHDCGLCAQLALPSRAVLDEIYSKYYGSYPSFASEGETDERHAEFKAYIESGGVPLEGRALEIGSFDGKFLAKLKEGGMEVQGCDPNAAAADFARDSLGVETVHAYFEADTFAEDSFDLVVARLVLEHVPNPAEFLDGLERVVKQGGHVALEVPDCGLLASKGLEFWMVEHFSFFTASTFLRALRRHGFDGEVTSHQGILRVIAKQVGRDNVPVDDPEADLAMALAFNAKYSGIVSVYNGLFDDARRNALPIGVYGVGNFFTNLISSTNLEPEELAGIFDGNPGKWNVKLGGLGLRIKGPTDLQADSIGVAIVATQSYEGVLKAIAPYLEDGGTAIVALPEPRLVQPVGK